MGSASHSHHSKTTPITTTHNTHRPGMLRRAAPLSSAGRSARQAGGLRRHARRAGSKRLWGLAPPRGQPASLCVQGVPREATPMATWHGTVCMPRATAHQVLHVRGPRTTSRTAAAQAACVPPPARHVQSSNASVPRLPASAPALPRPCASRHPSHSSGSPADGGSARPFPNASLPAPQAARAPQPPRSKSALRRAATKLPATQQRPSLLAPPPGALHSSPPTP